MLKGFMIFLTATFWLVSWSRAELEHHNETTCQPLMRAVKGGRGKAIDERAGKYTRRVQTLPFPRVADPNISR